MEIPRSLTLEIAREVAGRVKESVLSSIRLASQTGTPAGELQVREAPRIAKEEPGKRIPLDDVSALIDQITGQGPG